MAGLSISFTITKNALPVIGESVRRELTKVVRQTANEVIADAQAEIQQGEKSGRIYKIGSHGEREVTFNAGAKGEKTVIFGQRRDGAGNAIEPKFTVDHQASAPGEAPATDTGNLVNSFAQSLLADDGMTAQIQVHSEYAAALEFGSVANHMEARPFLGPAMKKNEDAFRERCEAAIAKGMAEGAA